MIKIMNLEIFDVGKNRIERFSETFINWMLHTRKKERFCGVKQQYILIALRQKKPSYQYALSCAGDGFSPRSCKCWSRALLLIKKRRVKMERCQSVLQLWS